ncbi:MAG TPA: MarP family serine protease [Candidatus Saccharimonadales bacterium]
MNLLDVAILIALIVAMWHGIGLGLVRQLGSTVGLVGGLFLGAFLETKLTHLAHTPTTRAALALVVIWGVAALCWSAGEWLGALLKYELRGQLINRLDGALGSIIGGITLLLAVWLGASVFGNAPLTALKQQIHTSRIVATLNSELPAVPNLLGRIGNIIEPNSFPQVFTGLEPSVSTNAPLPNIGELNAAVAADQASVVKIVGNGCGGIVEGSGFVAGNGLVATNAHVVAGVAHPEVLDGNGMHDATVVWFDPNLDFAVLRVSNLKGAPLTIDTKAASNGTAAAVLGYPGDGSFTAGAALVLEQFEAVGRNIYNQGQTTRSVYSIKATVRPGNSGGPLVEKDGDVIGVVFAESTTNNQVGYALAANAVHSELAQASSRTAAVGTGACAE